MGTEEFLRTSPREMAALIAAHGREIERSELMTAQLIAMVANTGFRSCEKTRKPEEFMPSRWGQVKAPKPKRRTRKMIEAESRAIMGAYRKAMEERG